MNLGILELIILSIVLTMVGSIGLTIWIVTKTTSRSAGWMPFQPGPASSHPDGWYPDPTGRHQQRWFRAGRWTPQVRDGGATGAVLEDPI